MTGKILTAILISICFASCTKKHTVSISGTFDNISDEKIAFEKKTASAVLFLDSAQVDDNGKFSVKLDILNIEPAFISIKNRKGQQLLLLLVESGEKVNINYANKNYTIDGSQGSLYVKELSETLNKNVHTIDSLAKIMNSEQASEETVQAARLEIGKKIVEQKRASIRFVASHSKSYASIFALYQQYSGGTKVFNDTKDFLFYKMVLDSMDTKYAQAEYMNIVKRDYNALLRTLELQNKIDLQNIEVIDYPDFELPDRNGKQIKLSSLEGNTVLLMFWSSETQGSQLDNKALLDIYEKYHSKGFEIYQVSFDTDRELWLRALNIQKLPWINVCDFRGAGSLPFGLYNVKQLPSNIIIDKAGQLVARDIFGEELERKVESLCK